MTSTNRAPYVQPFIAWELWKNGERRKRRGPSNCYIKQVPYSSYTFSFAILHTPLQQTLHLEQTVLTKSRVNSIIAML